jgi:MHS family alpha-ketoglutarate permease-like MFS transporter
MSSPAVEISTVTVAPSQRRAIIAGSIGNLVEWYDWGVYGFLAPIFAAQFFPSHVAFVSLLLTFSAFALGFFMRPIGGLFLGAYGDRYGRRNALILTIGLMALGSLIIGILPGYPTIGVAAPAILVLARLVQGFSAGGEFGGSCAFLVEYAPFMRRAFIGSWQQVSVGTGTILGSAIAALLTGVMPHGALYSWGWRIPFLLGGLIGLYALYLRLSVKDTPAFERLEESEQVARAPVLEAITRYPLESLRVMGITLAGTLTYYMWLIYMPTYVHSTTGMPLSRALQINLISLIIFVILIPFMGILSDRVGRKPVLSTFALGFVILSYPLFRFVTNSVWHIFVVELVGIFFLSMFSGNIATTMAEQFPTRVRTSGIAFPYALAVAMFGGTAPFITTYLISIHNYVGVAGYVIVASAISAVVYLTMPETRTKVLIQT